MSTEPNAPERPEVQAVVLVGGQGTRLRPLTLSAPKPMLPTAGLPFLTHLLSRIRAAGIDDVVLGTSFKAEVFSEYYGDGSKLDMKLRYVTETEPLGTGGGIRNVLPELTADTILVFNGDVLGGTNVRDVLDTHATSGADVTMHLVRVGDPRAFGCVPTDETGRVTAFLEEDPGPAHRSDQRGNLRVPTLGHRGDSVGSSGVGRARGVPGVAGARASCSGAR